MQCGNCSIEFSIPPDDKQYYQNLSVPEPTWCIQCREMRRMTCGNEMYFYSNVCRLCNKKVVAQFGEDNPRPVYCVQCWWSDKWNAIDFGREIDWNRSIFEQIHEVELSTPHCCVSIDVASINSDYTHQAGQQKNCYLIFHATFAEDCYYGYGVKNAKDCADVHYCHSSNFCYECIDVKDCYSLAWSQDCFSCGSSAFLKDCVSCVDCFMCVGLRNKNYCFLNEQLTKEQYDAKMKEINTGSYLEVQKYLQQFEALKIKYPNRYLQNNMTENSLGDHLYNSRNAYYCFDTSDIEDSKYCTQMQLGVRHCYDIYQYGINAELCYESSNVGTNAYNVHFSYLCLWQVSNLSYCYETYSSSDCFGCYGLKQNKFCILNKQYSEEEYKMLRAKLIEKMTAEKEYGEFMPIKYSQAAYNETMANFYYPMTREQVLAKGWKWQDNLPGTYGKETVTSLPDNIKDVSEDIVNQVLKCECCTKNYKIISQELSFYKQHNYPLPRKCFDCRRLSRMQKRNPRLFWQRSCMCSESDHGHGEACNVPFYTTFAPNRPEIVYCEHCYQNRN